MVKKTNNRRVRIQASERSNIMCETSAETPTLSRRYPQNLSCIAKLEFHKKTFLGLGHNIWNIAEFKCAKLEGAL